MDPVEAEPKMLASVKKSHPDSYPWVSGSVVKVTATVPLETEMPLLALQPETVSEIVIVSLVIAVFVMGGSKVILPVTSLQRICAVLATPVTAQAGPDEVTNTTGSARTKTATNSDFFTCPPLDSPACRFRAPARNLCVAWSSRVQPPRQLKGHGGPVTTGQKAIVPFGVLQVITSTTKRLA